VAPPPPAALAGEGAGATYIVPADLGDRYRIDGNIVRAPRAIVKSFAAAWIAQQLRDGHGLR
jgi:hypothetical protein